MKSVIISSLFVLGLVACAQNPSKSVPKLVDSDDMILGLESGIFSETANLAEAKARVTLDKTGLVSYRIDADMTIADISKMTLFRFERSLKMNPKFVNFATYKAMKMGSPVAYQERSQTLATLVKLSESEKTITLLFSHAATGLSGTVVLSEGLHGLVNVESVHIEGKGLLAVDDPQGRTTRYYEEVPYWPYSIEKTIVAKLFGELEGTLDVKKIK